MNSTTESSLSPYDYQQQELNVLYAACEIVVAIFAVIGNSLVIFVFRKERRLRRRTNYYIVSLATADLLVGLLGIPFAILASVGRPVNLHACLFTVSLLVVLCTISIFCLVAVSVDRYWAILHPMGYSRNVRTKTALVIISVCWFAGTVVGFLPLMGWHNHSAQENHLCFFLSVMDFDYLLFLYFGTIITPAVLLIAFYAHIYQVVVKQLRQIVTMNPEKGSSTKGCTSGGTMIRMLGVQQTNEVKATQNLAIIVLFFMVCWIPLYTINCIIALKPGFQVNPTFMLCCIILSHMNSAGNPLLYAYHLRDFRAALKNFFVNLFARKQCCDHLTRSNYSHYGFQTRKKSSTASVCNLTNVNKVRIIAADNISTVNSTALIAIPTGEPNRAMWNISEHSSTGSSNSSKAAAYDKTLIRPGTPYRPRNTSEINTAFSATICGEDDYDDERSNEEETLPYHDYPLDDTLLSDNMKTVQLCPSGHACKTLSCSSLQLSRSIFLVENEHKTVVTEPKRPLGISLSNGCSTGKINFKLSPLKVVNVFQDKKVLSRSLSDSGNICVKSPLNRGVVSCGS